MKTKQLQNEKNLQKYDNFGFLRFGFLRFVREPTKNNSRTYSFADEIKGASAIHIVDGETMLQIYRYTQKRFKLQQQPVH